MCFILFEYSYELSAFLKSIPYYSLIHTFGPIAPCLCFLFPLDGRLSLTFCLYAKLEGLELHSQSSSNEQEELEAHC